MKIKIKAVTDTGQIRDHNEDSYVVREGRESPGGLDALMIVADGMGGHAAGEVASQMTVEGILDSLSSQSIMNVDWSGDAYASTLCRVIKSVNDQVWQAGQDFDKRGMGTTCVLAAIKGPHLFLAHVGDSRAYLLRDGELYQLTTDHSWVAEAVIQGSLTKEQARHHYNRNIITRAIGTNPTVEVDTTRKTLIKGDLVMICSDGLNSMLSDAQIRDILISHKFGAVTQSLIEKANLEGGEDNISVITALIKNTGKAMNNPYDGEKTQKIRNWRFGLKPWGNSRDLGGQDRRNT